MNKPFYISFNTKEMPGKLLAVKVTLDKEIISDMSKQLPLNLCNHPLYKDLYEYCKANPPNN